VTCSPEEEVLNSIPDEAVTGTVASLVKFCADNGIFGFENATGARVPVSIGEVHVDQMHSASFSLTATLGDDHRTWAVRIEAHE
jgi:hypothetical protein